jgi:vacuolar-type H+-ATPase subunit I/STV1
MFTEIMTAAPELAATAQTVRADGFLDLITVKSEEVKVAIESVTFVVVILMVVITAVKTKMSIAAILMSAIVGGIVLWLVNGGINVTKQLTDDEFSMPAVVSTTTV